SLGGIQKLLQLVDRLAQPSGAAETRGDLDRRPSLRQRWYLEDAQIVELVEAVVGVLVQELVENLTRIGAKAREELTVLAAEASGSVTAAGEGAVPSNVDEEVEGVDVLEA